MFSNIVVGVDEHQGSRDAIALAEQLVEPSGAVTLAHVYPGHARTWWGSSPADEATQRERALELLERTRQEDGITAELRPVGASSPGHGLHVLAEEQAADLLVLGSSRRGLLGRVLLSDDTQAALNGAPCAVAIAPAGYAQQPDGMREIGVAYNGSAESEHALRVARQLADDHGANLSAFEAVLIPTYAYMGGTAPIGCSTDELVDEARERILALDNVEAHAAYGQPAEELAIYSASLGLLIVGSRDYGPIGRLVHGSTSHALARTARCPLLVLTKAARTPQPADQSGNNQHAAVAK